jgi:hypothetical protein
MKPILKDFLRLNDDVTVHDYDLEAFSAALTKEHIRDGKAVRGDCGRQTLPPRARAAA